MTEWTDSDNEGLAEALRLWKRGQMVVKKGFGPQIYYFPASDEDIKAGHAVEYPCGRLDTEEAMGKLIGALKAKGAEIHFWLESVTVVFVEPTNIATGPTLCHAALAAIRKEKQS